MNIPKEYMDIASALKEAGEANEIASREDALQAIAILNQIVLVQSGDYLLYAACVNLLNRYVKFNKHELDYRFKNYLYPFIYTIMSEKPHFIRMYTMIDYSMRSLPLMMIDIMGIHCSFHQLQNDIIEKMARKLEYSFTTFDWDHIRKQQCASSFLKLSFENHSHLSYQTKNQKDLREAIRYSIDKYKSSETLSKHIPFIDHEKSLAMRRRVEKMNSNLQKNSEVVLVSMIGDSDPIRLNHDGPMLHIARHHQPSVIYLLLTSRMQNKEKIALIHKSIYQLYETKKWEKPKIEIQSITNNNPARFENFGFTELMNRVFELYHEHQILVNISSGTPQMIASMCLEIVTNKLRLVTIQVDSPSPQDAKIDNAVTHEEELHNNLDYNVNSKNRLFVTNLLEFNRSRNKQKLQAYIDKHEYGAAIEFMIENRLEKNRAYSMIKKAHDIELMRQKTSEMMNVSNLSLDIRYTIINYYLQWELEYNRKKYVNYILKSTSLMYAICKYYMKKTMYQSNAQLFWSMLEHNNKITLDSAKTIHPSFVKEVNKSPYWKSASTNLLLKLYLLLGSKDAFYDRMFQLRAIEANIRNQLAHEIDLTKTPAKKYEYDAQRMHQLMKEIIGITFKAEMSDINFDYFSRINREILKEINLI